MVDSTKNSNTTSSATDEDIIKLAKELGIKPEELDPNYVPEDVDKLDGDATEEEKKKARHAYKRQNDLIKTLRGEISKRDASLEAMKTEKEKPAAGTKALTVDDIYVQLQREALGNLGLEKAESEGAKALVQAEVVRLYGEKTAALRDEQRASHVADDVINTELDSINSLDDDDKAAVKETLKRLPAVQRIDKGVIRNAVYLVVGQKALRPQSTRDDGDGDGVDGTSDTGSGTTTPTHQTAQGKVAASAARSGSGVRLPRQPDGGVSKDATPEELVQMQKIGYNGNIADFREISRKAVKDYSGITA